MKKTNEKWLPKPQEEEATVKLMMGRDKKSASPALKLCWQIKVIIKPISG